MSKKLSKEITALIESMGAVKTEGRRSYTHVVKTYIGNLYLRVDTEGSIATLFGNFLDDVKRAKGELGHWKYNLHIDKKDPDVIKFVESHLNYVL